MIRNISIGIDLGTAKTRVVVGEFLKGEKNPKIIGIGEAETKGLRHGYITSARDASLSLRLALQSAERTSGIKIKRAFVALGDTTLRSEISSGVAIISKADGEVTALDVNKAVEEAEGNLNLVNKRVIRSFPISYRLDGKEVLGRLEGTRGTKLEVKTLFITYSSAHLEDLLEVISECGVEPIAVVPSPLAASEITLSDKQKIVGTALVNIGCETTSVAVFEDGLLASLQTFSIGGADVTNDIALGLQIPLETAESFKLGSVYEDNSKKKLDEIIEARLSDIFELIGNHLTKIKRNELLPGGIVFVGGSANIRGLEEFSKGALRLPSRVGGSDLWGNTKTKLRDPAWFVALGLLTADTGGESIYPGSLSGFFKDVKRLIKSSFNQLRP